MSNSAHVILSRDRMPSPSDWANAIHEAGFEVELNREFDVFSFAGFLPCPQGTGDAGFEYHFEPLTSEILDQLGLPRSQLGARDSMASFVWGSRERDSDNAAVAAGVLAQLADGVIIDPMLPEPIPSERAIAWARGEAALPVATSTESPILAKLRSISILTYVVWGGVLLYGLYRCAA